jgi:uncharacterized membrane protein
VVNARELLAQNRLAQLAFLAGSFAVATLVAKAFDAGWGTAASFGQMAFVAAVVAVLLIGRR